MAGAVVALALVAQAVATTADQDPPASPLLCPSPEAPVAEAGYVPLGGIEQWVTITGRRCANPIVLFLHGGPGNPLSPYADALFAGWDDAYTLVQWDQRGAGRTFGRHQPDETTPLTVQRMTEDGLALAEYLTQRLGQSKVIVVGGSWGSVLGVHMVKARPSLFHAYVGFAQIVGATRNQSATYSRLLVLARERDDAQSIDALEAMGSPPWTNPRNPGIVRRITRRYEAPLVDAPPAHWWVRAPASDTPQLLAWDEQGEAYSYLQFVGLDGNGMFAGVDLPALGTRFDVPVFMVQGTEDLVTVADVTREYFERISAPDKALMVVPRTGHDPNTAMLDAIRTVLDQRARPGAGVNRD